MRVSTSWSCPRTELRQHGNDFVRSGYLICIRPRLAVAVDEYDLYPDHQCRDRGKHGERQGIRRSSRIGQIVDHGCAVTCGLNTGRQRICASFSADESVLHKRCTMLMRGATPNAPLYRNRSVPSGLIYCFQERKMIGTTVALNRCNDPRSEI